MRYGFGIDVGGTLVKLAYFNENGELLEKWEIPTDTSDGGKNILKDIAREVKHFLRTRRIPETDILGIGIGVPGQANRQGVASNCANLGWGVVNVGEDLQEFTGFPVKVGNDANLATLGECWKGGGKGRQNIVMTTLGTGVGGGIVVDGRIINGAHGVGGELGHLVLNREETEACTCGKYGCVEQYCSATGIVRTALRHLNRSVSPSSLRDIPNLTCKDVFDAGAAGDAVAAEILEQVYLQLAEYISDVCCVIDPEVVVIGGGVSKAGQPLIDGIWRHMHKYLFHAISGVELVLAQLGNDAGAYGAFKLILDAQS